LKSTYTLIALLVLGFLSGCAERSDPAGPTGIDDAFVLLSQTQTPGWAEDVWVYDTLAFVADGEAGVTIYDISNLSAPQNVSRLGTSSGAEKVAFSPAANVILVNESSGLGGVTFYDYATSGRKKTIFDLGLEEFGFFEVSSDTVIVCEVDRTEGFKVFTVVYDAQYDDWDETSIRGAVFSLGGTARGLDFDHEFAYIANNQLGMRILQIHYSAIANSVTPLGMIDTPGAARDVALTADKHYTVVADYQCGICVIDVSNKDNPRLRGSVTPEKADAIIKVKVIDNTAYFIDQHTALYAADVSNPNAPRLVGKYLAPEPVNLFVTDDQTVFLADEDLGLLILKLR